MILFFESLIMIIGVLLGVAFVTLCERKLLGYVQLRKGPNKVGFIGILQPISDALKLFSKEMIVLEVSNYWIYYICSGFSLVLMLMMWFIIPFWGGYLDMNLGLIVFMCFLGMGVYSMLGAGWSSNSSYGLLGGMRSVAQTISYEVSLALIIFGLIIFLGSYKMDIFLNVKIFFMMFFLVGLMWLFSLLAELNRTPFDFSEGESELVSGFNIEYSSISFALIFMAEYGMILFFSVMSCVLFMGGVNLAISVFMSMIIIVIRGSYPRYRYDKLMSVAWSVILPGIVMVIWLHCCQVMFL